MAKINFTTEKELNNCNPELVSKVRKVTSLDELKTLTDEYDMNQVEDAMFAILAEDGNSTSDLEEAITDLLWDEYYDHIYEDVCGAFLNRNERSPR